MFVDHVQWKCFTKKKLLEWEGDFGPESLTVDESYKLTDLDNEREAELSTFWVPEVWEGWRIDNRIYLGIRPLPEQRNSVTDPAQCKISYNGFRSKPSFLKLGLVWQKLYIILWYRLEMALAKSKGTLAVLPLQAIPNGQGKEGYDKETFLYTSEALGMVLLDLEADGMEGRTLNNMVAKIDMNQYQDIKFFIELLEYVKTTWDELVGINKQRKGQISASQGLGTNEQSIAQSTAVTEIFYYEFEKLEARDISRMLDYSKFAYKNGKVAAFLRDDLTEEFIDIDPDVHLFAEYGVHVVKSAIENQKLQQLKQAGVNLASQGNRPSVIAEILDASSFAQAKRVLSALESKEMKMAQEQSQSEQEAQQKMQQLQQEFEAYKQQLETQGQIAVDDNRIAKETEKELTVLSAQPQEEVTAPTDNSAIEREKLQSAEKQNNSKVGIENKKLAADIYTKELDAATKLAVAKENKNKHDTNKKSK